MSDAWRSGLVFKELFETETGYDETWSSGETIGSGCTLDEDYDSTNAGSPAGWGAQCLRSVAASTGYNAYVEDGNLGSAEAVTYFCMEIYIVSEGYSAGEWMELARANDSSWSAAWILYLIGNGSGVPELALSSYHDGSDNGYYSLSTLSTETVHRIEIKWDATNDAWAWRLDGVDQPNDADSSDPVESEGALTSTHPTDIQYLNVGMRNIDSAAVEVLIDRVLVSTSGWIGAADYHFEELFESPGYDEFYTAGEQVGSGCTLDENYDSSNAGSPAGWGDKCLRADVAASGYYAYNWHGPFGELATSYFCGEVYIVSGTDAWGSDWSAMEIFEVRNSAKNQVYNLRIRKDTGGNLVFTIAADHDGSGFSYYNSIATLSTGNVYRTEVKWDAANDAWAWRVDGVDQPNNVDSSSPVESEGTLTATHPTECAYVRVGVANSTSETIEVLQDRVIVSDTDWVGAAAGTGGGGYSVIHHHYKHLLSGGAVAQ